MAEEFHKGRINSLSSVLMNTADKINNHTDKMNYHTTKMNHQANRGSTRLSSLPLADTQLFLSQVLADDYSLLSHGQTLHSSPTTVLYCLCIVGHHLTLTTLWLLVSVKLLFLPKSVEMNFPLNAYGSSLHLIIVHKSVYQMNVM